MINQFWMSKFSFYKVHFYSSHYIQFSTSDCSETTYNKMQMLYINKKITRIKFFFISHFTLKGIFILMNMGQSVCLLFSLLLAWLYLREPAKDRQSMFCICKAVGYLNLIQTVCSGFIYIQYHDIVQSIHAHICPQVYFQVPHGTERALTDCVGCRHNNEQLE